MSIGDYLLPWKAIPNMIRDVKGAGGKDNKHGSVVGAIGKYADPVGALFGDRWMEFFHERIPSKMNEYSSSIARRDPSIQLDRKYGFGQQGSPLRPVSNWAQNRPADTTAMVVGAVVGGGAIAGGAGSGSAGGGAAGGTAAGGGAGGGGFNFGSLMGMNPGDLMGTSPMQPPPPPNRYTYRPTLVVPPYRGLI